MKSEYRVPTGVSWKSGKCPGKSWKLMNFRKLRLIGIWNDDCCSISLKFEIPSIHFWVKMSWKLAQKCPGKVLEMNQDIRVGTLYFNGKFE